ncbi:MAG TPA: DUF4349 domain-containing protein [Candidatus Limnocylindrales bacterium]|jgi:hypothetical protein|nr:DUF4349 domain-containing protein [Candidatus Limnocylindrales bacterium]
MERWLERRPTAAIVLFVGAIVVLVGLLALSGGETPKILSTVGAPVSNGQPGIASGPEAQPAPTSAPTGPQIAAADALAPAPGLLIVHTGKLAVRVDAIAASIDRASSIATGAGGYVAASRTSGAGADATATIDLRIPAARWDTTLTAIRGIGTVLDQEIGSDEVTGQVIDLDARVANLRATEAALQAIMAKATKIDDILSVQKQLTDTRGEIEQLTAKAAGLRDRAAFGSLSVALSLPAPAATPKPAPSRPPVWDPGRDAALAGGTLVRMGQLGTTAGIWLAIVGVPVVVSLLLALGILRLAWLGARRLGWVGG